MENRDLQGSWGGATVRQDYAMMMMFMDHSLDQRVTAYAYTPRIGMRAATKLPTQSRAYDRFLDTASSRRAKKRKN